MNFKLHASSLVLPSHLFAPQIDALLEVVRAVGGRVEVYMDGGVRQGTDVLKALAMGAKAVFIGRPVLWGLVYKVSIGHSYCLIVACSCVQILYISM